MKQRNQAMLRAPTIGGVPIISDPLFGAYVEERSGTPLRPDHGDPSLNSSVARLATS
ncbi:MULTISPECIES: hypothetical protein [Cupriavidus]|uniref:Uncharacterized protein n=1 Tax=Cupriavidus basilensis TaxID=68895 RepID=A0A7M2H9Q6_9BURK|nr:MULTISPECIES: hypothetical protein [Cupriavidus]QOT81603.1 hypothetical protein F7R26_036890 [Cupriavidus basilensis]BDB30196.1 hypothetical protein CTP10_R76130 [Cupriavidus sp. P-10]